MSYLYVFVDESGNYDFSANGTSHWVLTSLMLSMWRASGIQLDLQQDGNVEFHGIVFPFPVLFHAETGGLETSLPRAIPTSPGYALSVVPGHRCWGG